MALAFAQSVLAEGRMMKSAPLAVAVVDLSGAPLVLFRSDGAPPMWARIAIAKAETVLDFGCSTEQVGELVAEHAQLMRDVAGLSAGARVTVAGGVPLYSDGRLIGAAGVAGDTSAHDAACASRAAAAVGLEIAIM